MTIMNYIILSVKMQAPNSEIIAAKEISALGIARALALRGWRSLHKIRKWALEPLLLLGKQAPPLRKNRTHSPDAAV